MNYMLLVLRSQMQALMALTQFLAGNGEELVARWVLSVFLLKPLSYEGTYCFQYFGQKIY